MAIRTKTRAVRKVRRTSARKSSYAGRRATRSYGRAGTRYSTRRRYGR